MRTRSGGTGSGRRKGSNCPAGALGSVTAGPREKCCKVLHANHSWTYDIVEDRTANGRKLRMLTVLDEYTRVSLSVLAERSMSSARVISTLEWLVMIHGAPEHIRSDNDPEFSLRGRAKEAERALEDACILRFWTLRPKGSTPVLRSDNGLVFQSRRFRAACRDYHLRQEFITPCTPEQNGMIERFFRSLKEECTWQHNFETFDEARSTINTWIRFYNEERPHQSLGYLSPHEYRAQQLNQVA